MKKLMLVFASRTKSTKVVVRLFLQESPKVGLSTRKFVETQSFWRFVEVQGISQ